MTRIAVTGVAFAGLVIGADTAFAHVGHVGELAGHSHWVGIAAIAAAAALAVGVAVVRRRKPQDDISEEADSETTDSAEEGAR